MGWGESKVGTAFREALVASRSGLAKKNKGCGSTQEFALRGEVQDLECWQAVDSSGGDAARDR
ncbi:hypothetical protein N7478_010973 [Penicillium angulare]|uniref:uncharacterized protein n=1 Tax=Penicillium angulare TaxID=116970 RepID=UPI002541E73E|nr:uncharacterized protein N7478_010973 [Penicillium angulare]KAJ5263368.1 hypothetical protein N7478_010973 [Penicillium angulare]